MIRDAQLEGGLIKSRAHFNKIYDRINNITDENVVEYIDEDGNTQYSQDDEELFAAWGDPMDHENYGD